ncbi:hypothetical protein LTR66_001950 [Elasticomyces elasticus]|nr:hypothetical protein LTR66_001950 [Elasticomyces elasticus]
MSTGGLSLALSGTPHRFNGLDTIGAVVFLFDVALFIIICAGISTRFIRVPGSLLRSLRHPTEALFFPTFWLSISTLMGCMQRYGVPSTGSWLVVAVRVLFWIYAASTFLIACFQYWYLFTAKQLTIQSMTPAWILPIFPAMLCGSQPPVHRLPIIVAGVTFQGLGMTVSFLMYSIYIHRLMEMGLPSPNLRPGMFIAVGPPAFTALALIGMVDALPENYGYFATYPLAVHALRPMALFIGIFLWALALWFFSIALISVLAGVREMSFHLVWWAFVFPNVGFTIATISIGEQLGSEGVLWIGSAMTILLVCAWLFVFTHHVKAVLARRIMMPGMDEDKDEYEEDDDHQA